MTKLSIEEIQQEIPGILVADIIHDFYREYGQSYDTSVAYPVGPINTMLGLAVKNKKLFISNKEALDHTMDVNHPSFGTTINYVQENSYHNLEKKLKDKESQGKLFSFILVLSLLFNAGFFWTLLMFTGV